MTPEKIVGLAIKGKIIGGKNMKKVKVIMAIVIVGIFGVFSWGFLKGEYHRNIRATERVTYEGRVTAMEQGDSWSYIYLNSNAQRIFVRGNKLQLAVGQEYQVIVDGNDSLINAVIIDEK